MQEAMARTCIREGANLVIGHHPHVVQGIDFIENIPVIYSLGNLCFGGTINLSGYDAMIVRASIFFESGKPETKTELIPIKTSSRYSENVNDFRPIPAEDIEKEIIRMKVQADTGFLLP
jgi:poly-gamma-glutamate synthesis protein (capsule biosynthesis protein)